MSLALLLLGKAMATDTTGERFDVQVRGQVVSQRCSVPKGSVAMIASMRPFVSVRTHVDLKIVRLGRRIWAVWAGA